MILPRGLKAAAGPNPDPKGDDYEPDVELTFSPAVPEVIRPFLVYSGLRLSFEVSGSSSCTTRIYYGGKTEVLLFFFCVWY